MFEYRFTTVKANPESDCLEQDVRQSAILSCMIIADEDAGIVDAVHARVPFPEEGWEKTCVASFFDNIFDAGAVVPTFAAMLKYKCERPNPTSDKLFATRSHGSYLWLANKNDRVKAYFKNITRPVFLSIDPQTLVIDACMHDSELLFNDDEQAQHELDVKWQAHRDGRKLIGILFNPSAALATLTQLFGDEPLISCDEGTGE
jgi:hypothetical protein